MAYIELPIAEELGREFPGILGPGRRGNKKLMFPWEHAWRMKAMSPPLLPR
jgi:hypothetical protein